MNDKIAIAIFASGKGTNADNIISYFEKIQNCKVSLVVTDKEDAGVLSIAERHQVDSITVNKEERKDYQHCMRELEKRDIQYIVLAGYLKKIPEALIKQFPNKIINIHPALLPSYGGKGMYGKHVHEAVIANHEKQSGITIHFVDEHYDNGDIIFQAACEVSPEDTPESLASKVHELEYAHFPRVIHEVIEKQRQR